MTTTPSEWTIGRLLAWMSERFQKANNETPRLDAQILLSQVLGCSRVELYTDSQRPVGEKERSVLREWVKRRLEGEPLAYIVGKKHWHTLEMKVDSRVLIPRPETETLLDYIFAFYSFLEKAPLRILDLCTGSGCLALALKARFPEAKVVGIDISADALMVAQVNSTQENLEVHWVQGDLSDAAFYKKLTSEWGYFDLVVSNPPYVTRSEWESLAPSVKDYEPRLALVSGEEGLDLARVIWAGHQDLQGEEGLRLFTMELFGGGPHKLCEQQLAVRDPHSLPVTLIPEEGNNPLALSDYEGKERFLWKAELPFRS